MSWLMRAACAGEDPALFDHFRYPSAYEALRICSNCQFTDECIEWVRPSKSFFDGVAGGVVWRNGYRVRADNTTREDRIISRRMGIGENEQTTEVSEIYGQRTLPFD